MSLTHCRALHGRVRTTPAACACLALLALAPAAQAQRPTPRRLDALGLMDGRVIEIRESAARPALSVPVTLEPGLSGTLELRRASPRRPGFRVFTADGGALRDAESVRTLTYRGGFFVDGVPVGTAGASVVGDDLFARIILDDGRDFFIQPQHTRTAEAALEGDAHVLFSSEDTIPDPNRVCAAMGSEHAYDASALAPRVAQVGPPLPATQVMVAEVAVDADYEYYQLYGSTGAVQTRVETLINLLNVQYERDVGIRLELSALVVRTSASDPYSGTDPGVLLDQLQDEWLSNQTGQPYDIAHLFTGKNLDGSVIGVAYVGAVCTAFGFGVSEVDFSANVESSTDLLAHEIGHNFNADHCSCPSYTMNPSLTTANRFHDTLTIPVIEAFRDAIACLEVGEGSGAGTEDDFDPPAVSITDPTDGEEVLSGTLRVQVSASDASGIDRVDFYIDGAGTAAASDTTSPYFADLDISALSDGTHTITAVATDGSVNENTANDAISIEVTFSPQADPGFPFVDVNGDGMFSVLNSDIQLSTSMFTDGQFTTYKAESGYAGAYNSGLVIPAGVGTLNVTGEKGLKIVAEGDVTINASIVCSGSSSGLSIRSKSGSLVLGDASNVSEITLSAVKKLQLLAAVDVSVEMVEVAAAKVQVKCTGDVTLGSGEFAGTSGVALKCADLVASDFALEADTTAGKLAVKCASLAGSGSTFEGLKVKLNAAGDLGVPGCSVLACASISGSVNLVSGGTLDLGGASVVAGKKVSVKKSTVDLSNATLANSDVAGKVQVKADTIAVDAATLMGGSQPPVLNGVVTGTPTSNGQGTVGCP